MHRPESNTIVAVTHVFFLLPPVASTYFLLLLVLTSSSPEIIQPPPPIQRGQNPDFRTTTLTSGSIPTYTSPDPTALITLLGPRLLSLEVRRQGPSLRRVRVEELGFEQLGLQFVQIGLREGGT